MTPLACNFYPLLICLNNIPPFMYKNIHMYLIERMDMRVLVFFFSVLKAESYPNFNAPLDEEPFVDVVLQV